MAGYPTPDNPVGDMAYICKPIFIPDDEAFAACLYGQLNEMTNDWYWTKAGTMTPEDAAYYMSVAVGLNNVDADGCMTCEQIIDCIENDIDTQLALTQYIQNTGIGDPNFGDPDTPMMPFRFTDEQLDTEIAPPPAGCDKDVLWAGIREMVQRLDDNGRDFLEDLQVIVDKAERVNSMIALVPIVGSMASAAINQFTEIIPDVLNLYNSYSSEAVLDEIACGLFSIVCSECRYPTFREVIDYYSGLGIPGLVDYVNLAVSAAMTAASTLISFSGVLVYHSIITFQLFFMYLGAKFNLANNQSSLGLWVSLGEDFPSDNWIALCGGCNEELNAYSQNFGVGMGDWILEIGTLGGGGIQSELVSGTQQIHLYIEFDEAWRSAGFSSIIDRESGGSVNDDLRLYQNNNTPPNATGSILDYNFPAAAYGEVITCHTGLGSAARTGLKVIYRDNNPENTMLLKQIKIWQGEVELPTNITGNSENECYT